MSGIGLGLTLSQIVAPLRSLKLTVLAVTELDLLDRMIEKPYLLPEDLALARIPDSQGLGA